MYHINKIFAIALIVFLTGCSIGGEKKIKIFQVEEPRKNLDYPMPTALQLEEIKWIIITSENAEEVFAKLEAAGIDPVLFGVTDKDFQILAKNFAQIRQKLQETTDYYKLDLKAVFISSKYETEAECREVGGLDFIRVPFESDKVLETMLKWSRVGKSIN